MAKGAASVKKIPKVPIVSGMIPGIIGKIGKGLNFLSFLPLPSTLRDIKDDFTGKTPDDYIKEYEKSVNESEFQIAAVGRKITSLENRLDAIINRPPPRGFPQKNDRAELQKQINSLGDERRALESGILLLKQRIRDKSLERDIDRLNQGNANSRLSPVQS